MSSRYESMIDRQIREAQERGEFDNLPGAGRPLSDSGTPADENWWLKAFVHRENVGPSALPTTLRLRRECEDLPRRVAREHSESRVREIVADLNQRIIAARRGPVDGPPVPLATIDPDQVVQAWRRAR